MSKIVSFGLLYSCGLTLQRPRTARTRKPLRAHLRLDVFADPSKTPYVAGQQRERDGKQKVGHVALLANGTDVYLEADMPLKHRRSSPVPLVLYPKRHRRYYAVRQLSHLEERGGSE